MDSHTSVRASDPNDILAVIPYLLGFHPQDSMILVAVRGRRVIVTARMDLTETTSLTAMVEHFRYITERHDVEAIVLVAYTDQAQLGKAALDVAVEELGHVEVIDALLADGVRWWSQLCSRPQCCPVEGTPYDVASTEIAARAVMAGMPALASRAELADRAAPPPAQSRARLEAAYEATLWAAVLNAQRGQSRNVYLTQLGGGAFGNHPDWILQAMERALARVADQDLTVHLVSYRSVAPELAALAQRRSR